MDISETLLSDSTQINAVDLIKPVTVTVAGVTRGTTDQPVEIHLVEFPGKAFRPCKTVRRALAEGWGTQADDWIGRRMTIFNEPSVKWAGEPVGGVRVSAMSRFSTTGKRTYPAGGKSKSVITITDLPDGPTPEPTSTFDPDTCDDPAELRRQWKTADPAARSRIEARVTALAEQTP